MHGTVIALNKVSYLNIPNYRGLTMKKMLIFCAIVLSMNGTSFAAEVKDNPTFDKVQAELWQRGLADERQTDDSMMGESEFLEDQDLGEGNELEKLVYDSDEGYFPEELAKALVKLNEVAK